MLNLKTYEQKDFQAGEVHDQPDNLLPENAVLRLLNLIPGDSAEPLGLRGGFQPWSYGISYNGEVSYITDYTAHLVEDDDEYVPFLSSAFIVFEKDSTDSNTNVHIVIPQNNVSVPTIKDSSGNLILVDRDASGNMVLDVSGHPIITDEPIWREFGAIEYDTGIPSDIPSPAAPPPFDKIVLSFYDLTSKNYYPTTPLVFPVDYWTDDAGNIDSRTAGDNDSLWGSDSIDADIVPTYTEDWDTLYWNEPAWVVQDIWVGESGSVSGNSIFNVSGSVLTIRHPICFSQSTPDNQSQIMPFMLPNAEKPSFISKNIDLMAANRRMYVKFSEGAYGHSGINVYVRKSGMADSASWGTPVNGSSPIHIVQPQSALSDPAKREDDYADGTIGIDFVCQYSKVDIKIESCVSDVFVSDDGETSATFVGIEVV